MESKKQLYSHKWKAEEYHHNSSVQLTASEELLQKFQFKGSENILDVGCGDGKISALIASLVPSGTVLAIDISSEMIEFARRTFPKSVYTNLNFLHLDAEQINFTENFDIVFSSFSVQWILNHDVFFKGTYKALKPNGLFVCLYPLSASEALDQAVNELISASSWKKYFSSYKKPWKIISKEEFKEELSSHLFDILKFDEVSQEHRFPSRKAFEKYVLQWFTYIDPLPENLKFIFFNQVLDNYLKKEPLLDSGEVVFKFSRLEIIAKKI